jgi:hypothetical protein
MDRPASSEHHEYYGAYIDQVPDGDILDVLREGVEATATLVAGQPESFGEHRYAPGKWTVKELLTHVIDAERVFGFRAFWFARKGPAALPGYDQDPFTAAAEGSRRSLESLVGELRTVRAANLTFFASIDDEASRRTGIASDVEFSVRAFAYIAAGHEIHHRKQLRDLYLPSYRT